MVYCQFSQLFLLDCIPSVAIPTASTRTIEHSSTIWISSRYMGCTSVLSGWTSSCSWTTEVTRFESRISSYSFSSCARILTCSALERPSPERLSQEVIIDINFFAASISSLSWFSGVEDDMVRFVLGASTPGFWWCTEQVVALLWGHKPFCSHLKTGMVHSIKARSGQVSVQPTHTGLTSY